AARGFVRMWRQSGLAEDALRRIPGLVLPLPVAEAGRRTEILEHGHVGERLRHLVAAPEPATAALVRAQACDVAPLVVHAAALASHVAADQVEERRLAGAVRPEDAERLALGHRKRDVVDDLERAVRLADRSQREQGHLISCRGPAR